MISLTQIQHFSVLAKTLHFAKAASQLEISQATLSCEIKKMEKSLGFQLFDRANKWNIKLTAAGQSYYDGVKNIPYDISRAYDNAVKSARGESGHISIAVNNIVYDYINLGEICKKMKILYPEVHIRIFDMPMGQKRFEYLINGKVDLALFAGSTNLIMPEGFCTKNIMPLNFALAIPGSSRLAKMENITVEALKQTHFVLPPREEAPNLRRTLDEIFMEHCNSLPIVAQEVIGYHATLQFVEAGLGVGFVFMRRNNPLPEQVVLRELPIRTDRSLLAGFQEHINSPVINNFLRILQKNCEN
ncbi:MAG: LysR family transcriptional regulator [Lentisphaerae bacterium]|nr:LysR family transcriptional regulator [Lentisphaerota bacterium]